MDSDVIRPRRGVDVLKDVGRRVFVPTSDARVVSVVDGDVQRRRRDGGVCIAVHECFRIAAEFQVIPVARIEEEGEVQQLYEEVISVGAFNTQSF